MSNRFRFLTTPTVTGRRVARPRTRTDELAAALSNRPLQLQIKSMQEPSATKVDERPPPVSFLVGFGVYINETSFHAKPSYRREAFSDHVSALARMPVGRYILLRLFSLVAGIGAIVLGLVVLLAEQRRSELDWLLWGALVALLALAIGSSVYLYVFSVRARAALNSRRAILHEIDHARRQAEQASGHEPDPRKPRRKRK